MNFIIVSRHPATVEFIRRTDPRFFFSPALADVTPEDLQGTTVAGNLPLHLAALVDAVYTVAFRGDPPRGREYTAQEMEAAGAYLDGPFSVWRTRVANLQNDCWRHSGGMFVPEHAARG